MERIGYQDIPEGMFENLLETENYINGSSLGMHLLEMVRLRVSQINGCAYCVDMHHKELKHAGESELRLSSLCVWSATPYFSDKERAVLQFTEALTRLGVQGISEAVFDDLQKYFSKNEICFLTLAVSQINTWTRLMKTFQFSPGNHKIQMNEAS